MKYLSFAAAKSYYDAWGCQQDSQEYYESPAFEAILSRLVLQKLSQIFELGCGTGLLAERLFKAAPQAHFRYQAVDISSEMLRLTSERLKTWGERVDLDISNGEPAYGFGDESLDLFVSTYVLDILSPESIQKVICEAHRGLSVGSQLVLAGITPGHDFWSKWRMSFWRLRYRMNPLNVGGCRPMDLGVYLEPQDWAIEHRELICRRGISSEVLFARKR